MAAEKEQPNSLLRFLTDETDFLLTVLRSTHSTIRYRPFV
jgi:hypothetical protein